MSVNIGSGNIIVDNTTQSLHIDGGSVEGTIKNITGTGVFSYGSGSLNFIWDILPLLPVNLIFSIGSGFANLRAPAAAIINTKGIDSTPGFFGFGGFVLKSEFSDTAESIYSPHITISGSDGSGIISIKKNLCS